MKVSIKLMLPLAFVILAASLFLIGTLANVYLQDVIKIRDFDDKIENLHLLSHELYLTDQNFFTFATVSPAFYQSGSSLELQQHDSLRTLITQERRDIATLLRHTPQAQQQITIDSLFEVYDATLDQAFRIIRTRGFKDYGLEGNMRQHAHWLEDSSKNAADILMLRRHEKDYFLRNDLAYVDLFNRLCDQVVTGYQSNRASAYHLNQYRATFNRIVTLEQQIGLSTENSLQIRILGLADQINQELTQLSATSHQEVATIIQEREKKFYWLIGASLLVILGIAYFICDQLVTPLSGLIRTINHNISNDYRSYSPVKLSSSVKEIKILETSFDALIRQLQTLLEASEQSNQELEVQNQVLTKTNRELDMLVYSASHDLRAPLTSLEGLVTLSRDEADAAERTEYHELMLGRIKHLDGFIQDIVDYARNNRQTVVSKEISMNDLVDQTLMNYSFLEQYSKIHQQIEVAQPVAFCSDPTRLSVILKNLISNAIRYYDPAKANPSVKITASVSLSYLHLTVTDNGLGIPEDQQSKIFDMFYRASDQARGSGLGLFIVQEMVNRLGGKIRVQSVEGEGTTFALTIPNLMPLAKHQTSSVRKPAVSN